MIDDIQFIAGKESTQEEFFHTFNALYQAGKQVVISSDRPPRAIAALEDRLRSRFEGGLIADVGLPDFEMRTAILRTKGETSWGSPCRTRVVEYVAAERPDQHPRAGRRPQQDPGPQPAHRTPLTLALAMEALTGAGAGAGGPPSKATVDTVVEAVAAYYKVHLKDVRGRGRTKEIVLPRQVAMYLIREETDLSLGRHRQGTGRPRPHHRHARHRQDRAGPLRRRRPPLPGDRHPRGDLHRDVSYQLSAVKGTDSSRPRERRARRLARLIAASGPNAQAQSGASRFPHCALGTRNLY